MIIRIMCRRDPAAVFRRSRSWPAARSSFPSEEIDDPGGSLVVPVLRAASE
jgi:hypothetical protein